MTKIRRFALKKLVRDNIEQFFLDSGAVHVTKRVLVDSEFNVCLREKAIEEAHEVADAKTDEELVNECADLMEVMNALLVLNGKTWEEVLAACEHKATTRGVYDKRLFVDYVDLPDGSKAADYFSADPKKYSELPVE